MFYAIKVFLTNGDWGYYYACPSRLDKDLHRGVREFDTYDECMDFYHSKLSSMTFNGSSVSSIQVVKCG